MTPTLLAWVLCAAAQDAPVDPPSTPPNEAVPAPADDAPPAPAPQAEAPAEDDREDDGEDDTGTAEDAWETAQERATPPVDDRYLDGTPVLGPWGDDWAPDASPAAAQPRIDTVSGAVIEQPAEILGGPAQGPQPPIQVGPQLPDPDAEEPLLVPLVDPLPPEAPGPLRDARTPADEPDFPLDELPSVREALREVPPPPTPTLPQSLLPPPPETGVGPALRLFLTAGILLLVTGLAERIAQGLSRTGVLPTILRTTVGTGRALAVPLAILSVAALLPASWSAVMPFVLVSIAVALGWTSRDLLADLFAGVVLTAEQRFSVGDRIEIDGNQGIVTAVGLRSTQMRTDEGLIVTLPNRNLVTTVVRGDPDPYAPVTVPVHVAAAHGVQHLRQTLEELALLSPYVAPSRPPLVYRNPDRDHVWMVQVRLLDARYANAFRGALVELADEVFAGQPPAASTLPPDEGD